MKCIKNSIAYVEYTIIPTLHETQNVLYEEVVQYLDHALSLYKAGSLCFNLKKTRCYAVCVKSLYWHATRWKMQADTSAYWWYSKFSVNFTLDPKLTSSAHCQSIIYKRACTIPLLGKRCTFFDLPQALKIYLMIIHPCFEYWLLYFTALPFNNFSLLGKC